MRSTAPLPTHAPTPEKYLSCHHHLATVNVRLRVHHMLTHARCLNNGKAGSVPAHGPVCFQQGGSPPQHWHMRTCWMPRQLSRPLMFLKTLSL